MIPLSPRSGVKKTKNTLPGVPDSHAQHHACSILEEPKRVYIRYDSFVTNSLKWIPKCPEPLHPPYNRCGKHEYADNDHDIIFTMPFRRREPRTLRMFPEAAQIHCIRYRLNAMQRGEYERCRNGYKMLKALHNRALTLAESKSTRLHGIRDMPEFRLQIWNIAKCDTERIGNFVRNADSI